MRKTTSTKRTVRPGQLGVACTLLTAVVVSAMAVVYSTYQARQLFNQTQQLHRDEWALEEEWERLLLEQSTWASHARVSQIAERELQMVSPDPAAMRVVP